MKAFLAYSKSVLSSPVFYLSVLCVAVLSFSGVDMNNLKYGGAVVNEIYSMLDIGSYRKMMLLFAALPFVSRYSTEINSGMEKQIIVRSSFKKYLSCHIFLSFITAFLVTFVGIHLCTMLLCIKYPFFTGNFPVSADTQQPILHLAASTDSIFLFYMLRVFHYSFSLGAWALSGLALSALFVNPYIAITAPLIFSYILELFTIGSKYFPDLWSLSLCYTKAFASAWGASAYIIFVFLALGGIFSAIFVLFAKRRMKNEIP